MGQQPRRHHRNSSRLPRRLSHHAYRKRPSKRPYLPYPHHLPHLGIHHLWASHSRLSATPPTTWEFEHITRAEIHQPLRIDAHRYGVITHIDNLGDLTPTTATRLLVTLAPTLHDAPTLVLSNASTRKVISYTTKNRRKESSILSGNLIKYAIGGRCVLASSSGEVVDLGEVVSVMAVG
ncbi:hypothetical protein [Corynebacterium belfantii]|uniref:hypothetical protein n=1 Tax=Corynebacterium belfantii TaxID=2014537 RepID=UPI001F23F1C7|nr:hypothetical protein [Corynebacterium belfantii]